jgi:hypothetical protein
MKLYIPEIGDRIKLEQDWCFTPVKESRNVGLFKFFMPKEVLDEMLITIYNWNYRTNTKIDDNYDKNFVIRYKEISSITNKELLKLNNFDIFSSQNIKRIAENFEVKIPKDSVLKIDRIYIRKGASDFSSVTFYIESIPGVKLKNKIRFFANLNDVNNIEVSINRMNFLKIGKSDSVKKLIDYCKYFTKEERYNWLGKFEPKEINVLFENKDILKIRAIGEGREDFIFEYKTGWGKNIKKVFKESEKISDWKLQIIESNEVIFETKKETDLIKFIENFVYEVYIKN